MAKNEPASSVKSARTEGRTERAPDQNLTLTAAIFDVDGVLVASPHERAWREALAGFADPAGFTTAFYQAHVAGKPRLDGARSALEQLGVAQASSWEAWRRLVDAGNLGIFGPHRSLAS